MSPPPDQSGPFPVLGREPNTGSGPPVLTENTRVDLRLLGAIVALAGGLAVMQFRVSDHAERLAKVESTGVSVGLQLQHMSDVQVQQNEDLKRIRDTGEHTALDVRDLRERVRR